MDNWLLLFFFLPFHVVGALALTLILRQWQETDRATQVFILAWAFLFLGMPLFMQGMAAPQFLMVTVPLTLGLPILFWWAGDTLRLVFRQPGIPAILGGSIALYFEMLVWGLLREEGELSADPLFIVFMGALALGSTFLLLYSVLKWWRWWQSGSDDAHTDAA